MLILTVHSVQTDTVVLYNIHSINLVLFHAITIHFNYEVRVFAVQSVCQLVVGFKTIIATILNLKTYVK